MKTRTRLLAALLLCAMLLSTSMMALTVSAEEGDIVTEYGTVPAAKANNSFAIFMNGEFQTAVGNWDAVWWRSEANGYNDYPTVHRLLKENPGATVQVVVLKDNVNTAGSMPDQASLGHLQGGKVIVDLGGNTVIVNKGNFIRAGLVNADYEPSVYNPDGPAKTQTDLTVKNGTVLGGNANILNLKSDVGEGGTSNVDFENVNFAFDDAVPTGKDIVFRGWGGSATTPFTLNVSFKDCSFDSRVYESKGFVDNNNNAKYVTWLYDGGNGANSVLTFKLEGCHFISDDEKLSVVRGTAANATTFVKDADGKYSTFEVKNGATWQTTTSLTTPEGKFNPKMLVKDGADYDVYTLPTLQTPYGTVDTTFAYHTFVVFMNGECQVGVGDWNAVWWRNPTTAAYNDWQTVYRLMIENPGASITVLVRQYVAKAGSMNDQAYLGHMAGGEVTVDLGGNTVITNGTGFIKIGLMDASYDPEGVEKTQTNLTVKNGTLLQGAGTMFMVQNKTADGGVTNVTFDGVTVGYDAATVPSGNDIIFRGWGAGYKVTDDGEAPGYIVNALFKNCTFDSTGYESKNYAGKTATWFFDAGSATGSMINYTVDGGQFISDDPTRMAIANSNAMDSTTFVKDGGSYATLSVPNGVVPAEEFPTAQGLADFSKLLTDGADRDVYTVQTYVTVDDTNLLYVIYNGEKSYTSIRVPEGAAYEAIYVNPDDYADKIVTENKNSIRLAADAGLRFATRLDADFVALLDGLLAANDIAGVEIGTLIAPETYAKDNGFTVEELDALDRSYLDVKGDYGCFFDFDEDENTTHFVGSIVNLYEQNVSRKFLGKGYVKVTLRSGQVVTLYAAEGHAASVQEVAQKAQADTAYYESLSDGNRVIIDTFAAGKAPERAD